MTARTTTGSKDNGTISSGTPSSGTNVTTVGGRTLLRTAGTFTSADFDDNRIVALYNSGSTTWKGIAWVRAYTDANEIELETPFIDDDGNDVTPINGDAWELSKNWADVDADDATGELTWSAATRTLTITAGASATFGVAADPNGICFYDEDVMIRSGDTTINTPNVITLLGGVFVHGHLLNYTTRKFYGGVSVHCSNDSAGSGGGTGDTITVNDAQAKVWWMGGHLNFDVTPARIPGGFIGNGCVPALWQKWWGITTNADLVTPDGGADWSARAVDQHFADTIHVPDSTNAIASRLADSGLVTGQTFKGIIGGTIISMYGSDSAGTYAIGSSPGERTLIRDLGGDSETSLWRSSGDEIQTINATNLISWDRTATIGAGGATQTNATINFYFSDIFNNVQAGSNFRVEENGDSSLEDEGTDVSGDVEATVLEAIITGGITETVQETDWDWQFANYSYQPVYGSFAVSTVSTLSGDAKDVAFNTFMNQLADLSITESSQTVVNNYTAIINGEQLYDRTKLYSVSNIGFPSITAQLCEADGTLLNFGAIDLILDADAASVYAVSQTGDGSITIRTVPENVITKVGSTEAISTGEDDEITIAFPGGIADDDVAYIAVGHSQSGENVWNTPSGWVIPTGLTEVQAGGTPASVPGVSVFRRVLSSDSGSVTITNVGTNVSGIVAQMVVYRGVDTTTPEDVAPVTASGASGDPDPGSITPVNTDCMILTFGFQDDGEQTSPTKPTNYTAIEDTATLDGRGTGE